MVEKINKKQYEELCESDVWDITEEFNKKLKQITGITARAYVCYLYFDSLGNYIGNNNCTVTELLNNAYIGIEDI